MTGTIWNKFEIILQNHIWNWKSSKDPLYLSVSIVPISCINLRIQVDERKEVKLVLVFVYCEAGAHHGCGLLSAERRISRGPLDLITESGEPIILAMGSFCRNWDFRWLWWSRCGIEAGTHCHNSNGCTLVLFSVKGKMKIDEKVAHY